MGVGCVSNKPRTMDWAALENSSLLCPFTRSHLSDIAPHSFPTPVPTTFLPHHRSARAWSR